MCNENESLMMTEILYENNYVFDTKIRFTEFHRKSNKTITLIPPLPSLILKKTFISIIPN